MDYFKTTRYSDRIPTTSQLQTRSRRARSHQKSCPAQDIGSLDPFPLAPESNEQLFLCLGHIPPRTLGSFSTRSLMRRHRSIPSIPACPLARTKQPKLRQTLRDGGWNYLRKRITYEGRWKRQQWWKHQKSKAKHLKWRIEERKLRRFTQDQEIAWRQQAREGRQKWKRLDQDRQNEIFSSSVPSNLSSDSWSADEEHGEGGVESRLTFRKQLQIKINRFYFRLLRPRNKQKPQSQRGMKNETENRPLFGLYSMPNTSIETTNNRQPFQSLQPASKPNNVSSGTFNNSSKVEMFKQDFPPHSRAPVEAKNRIRTQIPDASVKTSKNKQRNRPRSWAPGDADDASWPQSWVLKNETASLSSIATNAPFERLHPKKKALSLATKASSEISHPKNKPRPLSSPVKSAPLETTGVLQKRNEGLNMPPHVSNNFAWNRWLWDWVETPEKHNQTPPYIRFWLLKEDSLNIYHIVGGYEGSECHKYILDTHINSKIAGSDDSQVELKSLPHTGSLTLAHAKIMEAGESFRIAIRNPDDGSKQLLALKMKKDENAFK